MKIPVGVSNRHIHLKEEVYKLLFDEELSKRAEAVIAEEEAKLEEALIPYRKVLEGKKAILNTGGNKTWSIASALQDIGIDVVATSVKKATLEDREICAQYVKILMEDPSEQPKLIDEHNIDILLAGGRSLYTAIKKKVAFVDVNQTFKAMHLLLFRIYAGYRDWETDRKSVV